MKKIIMKRVKFSFLKSKKQLQLATQSCDINPLKPVKQYYYFIFRGLKTDTKLSKELVN